MIAETYKARGTAVRIAVAPGDYEVLVRHGTTLSRCDLEAGGVVDLDHCRNEAIETETTKGGGFEHRVRLDVGFLAGPERHDAYTDNLMNFGYNEKFLQPSNGVQIDSWWLYRPGLWLGAMTSTVALPSWSHGIAGSTASQSLDWRTTTLLAAARVERPFARTGFWRRLGGYALLGLGAGAGRTELTDAMGQHHIDWHFGPALSAGLGLHEQLDSGLGFDLGYQFDYAPVIHDLIGDTHAAGGHRLLAAFTYTF